MPLLEVDEGIPHVALVLFLARNLVVHRQVEEVVLVPEEQVDLVLEQTAGVLVRDVFDHECGAGVLVDLILRGYLVGVHLEAVERGGLALLRLLVFQEGQHFVAGVVRREVLQRRVARRRVRVPLGAEAAVELCSQLALRPETVLGTRQALAAPQLVYAVRRQIPARHEVLRRKTVGFAAFVGLISLIALLVHLQNLQKVAERNRGQVPELLHLDLVLHLDTFDLTSQNYFRRRVTQANLRCLYRVFKIIILASAFIHLGNIVCFKKKIIIRLHQKL